MFKLVSKVFVINLKSSVDRKKHIITEFSRIGITDYEIFEATDKDSDEVTNMMKTNFVKKFPPCFRCLQNECDCTNNVLIKHQIGNWSSLISVMKRVVTDDYEGLIMICEDDIKFMPFGMKILRKLINKKTFEMYGINMNEPLLIRAGAGFKNGQMHTMRVAPHFDRNRITMSNPCFFINKFFAQLFLDNLKIIDTTSDVYIHKQLCGSNKSIKHLTILPVPIYDLSTSVLGKFASEIHPNNLNYRLDPYGKNIHIKKMIYKEILCI